MLNFEQFYLNTKSIIYQYLYQHSEDFFETEDIAQETYLKALEEWEMLKEHPNPAGWLVLMAKHLCTGYHRHVYFRKNCVEEEVEIPYEEPAYNLLLMEDLLENVYKTKDRPIARKYFLEGDSIEELAQDFGGTPGAFRTKIYRMKRRLKRYIESYEKVW